MVALVEAVGVAVRDDAPGAVGRLERREHRDRRRALVGRRAAAAAAAQARAAAARGLLRIVARLLARLRLGLSLGRDTYTHHGQTQLP